MPISDQDLKADLFQRASVLIDRWNLADAKIKESKAAIVAETSAQDVVRASFGELRTAAKVFGVNLDDLVEERFRAADVAAQNQMDLLTDIPPSAPEPSAPAPQRPTLTIREEILAIALGTFPGAVRATPLRKEMEKTRGPLHEKTVGMTLYRLAREGLMRRDGWNWFFVPQNSRTKNPGGDTPGLNNAEH